MRLIILFLGSFWLASCGNDSSSDTANPFNDSITGVHAGAGDTIARSSVALENGCYEMIMKRDTARLSLTIKDTTISGKLDFHWYEKDHNTGHFKGFLQDSLIIADYTFESEGQTSVREVVFKLKGDTLLQGFGDLKEENGKVVFSHPDQLQYMQDHPFIRVECSHAHLR